MFPGGLPSLGGSFVFLDVHPSRFFPFIPPFFGCFDLFMIGKVSSFFCLGAKSGHKVVD